MTTSSNTPQPRVVVARSEVQTCLDQLRIVTETLTGILERPEPRPAETDEQGWPKLGWEAHDDPTYTGKTIPPVPGLHDSGDDQ